MTEHHKKSQTDDKKVIIYDGLCTMCKGIADSIDHSSQKASFKLSDLTSDALPAQVSRTAAEKEIHVIDSDGTIYKNSEAVLKILEEYPRYAWLVRIGRWPGLRQLLALAYGLVARNRHFIAGPAGRLYWTKVVLGISFLSGILISLQLWLGERAFPLAPVIGWLSLPHPYDYLLAGGLVATLGAIVISSKPRRYIFLLMVLVLVAGLLDQMRWQPWVYQYAAMLLALGLFSWRAGDKSNIQSVLNVCRLVIATTYIWSGLHKLNPAFINEVFPWMLQPVTNILPESLHAYLYASAVFIPIVETGIGIALLTNKFRNLAVAAAIGMHLSILALLGPVGQGWNSVVWPWNLAMIAFDILLFWNIGAVPLKKLVWNRKFAYHGVILVLFGLLPLLSLGGYYDKYLSSALYSGDIPRATVYVSSSESAALPASALNDAESTRDGTMAVSITNWSFEALQVPPYPEPRIYRTVAGHLCTQGAPNLKLLIRQGQTPWQRGYAHSYDCDDLK